MEYTENNTRIETSNLTKAEDTAYAVGLSKFTLYKLAKKNEIPHYRCGKAIRFDVNEVKAWMKEETGPGGNETETP